MKTRLLTGLAGIGLALAMGTGGAKAAPVLSNYDVNIHQFTVERSNLSGSFFGIYVQDNFDDGTPPPSGDIFVPTGSAADYSTRGTFTETAAGDGHSGGGFANMNQANAEVVTSSISGQSFAQHRARLRTSTDNSNDNGLKQSRTFAVEALFDLSVPDEIQEAYGIRLTDRLFVGGDLKVEGNNTLELAVRMNSSGDVLIQYRNFNYITDMVTSIDDALLQLTAVETLLPGATDQIKLRLDRLDVNSDVVTASYAFGSGGVFTTFTILDTISTGGFEAKIFQDEYDGRIGDVADEKYIRAQFFARSLADVPEPGTLAVFGLGLAGLALLRRRKAA